MYGHSIQADTNLALYLEEHSTHNSQEPPDYAAYCCSLIPAFVFLLKYT